MNPAVLSSVTAHFKNRTGVEFAPKTPAQTGTFFEAVVPETLIREVAQFLAKERFFLETLTATDFSDCFELAYFFNHWKEFSRCVFKVVIPKTRENATSIHDITPAANWFEREIHDMYGLPFRGHPNLKRLLLPESSAIHPLLKSFKGEPDGSDVKQSLQLIDEYKEGYEIRYPQEAVRYTDEYHLNLGPQHPSTHGVLRVLLHLKGERVLGAEPVIGYVHRNHEKMAEVQEYKAFWPNVGRLDYVGAMSYNFGYAGLIERAMGVEVSRRVQVIRVLLTELNRIASHLLWLGTYLLDLGAFTPFFYCFDDRERILDILENVTGERLTYDYFRFGGLDKDMPDEIVIKKTKAFIHAFRARLKDYEKLITGNVIFRKRTEGVGILDLDSALGYGVTGPSLRACGIGMDVRRHEPYSIYPELDFEVPVETGADAYARYRVRMREMAQSLKIAEQLLDKIPKGEYKSDKLPRFVPKVETYFAVEAARGSFGMYLVSDGTMQPYKLKLRTPSYSNLSVFGAIARNCFVADVVSILGSIDIVVPEIDR